MILNKSFLVKFLILLNIILIAILLLVYQQKTKILSPSSSKISLTLRDFKERSIGSSSRGLKDNRSFSPLDNTIFVELENHLTTSANVSSMGDKHLYSGDYESAITSYLDGLDKRPGDKILKKKIGYSFYGLGIIQLNRKEYGEAYDSFTNAIEYYQEDGRFYGAVGEVLTILNKYGEAEIFFSQGLKISPNQGTLYYGLGKVKYFTKEYQDAINYLDRALELNPDGIDILNLLAHSYFRLGDPIKAREYIMRALSIQPKNPVLLKFSERVEREYQVEKRFVRREGKYFIIKYDGERREDIGFRVERILYQARAEIGSKLGCFPDKPIPVILYSRQDFIKVTKVYDWTSGIYDGKIRIPIAGLNRENTNLRSCLFHEYTHALVEIICDGKSPSWLNEGLAQYFDGRRIDDWKHVLSSNDLEYPKITFYLVEQSFANIKDVKLVELLYAQSLLAVEYLYYRYSNRDIQILLKDIGKGKSCQVILRKRMRIGYDELMRDMVKYFYEKS